MPRNPQEETIEAVCCTIVNSYGGEAIKLKVAGTRGWPDRLVLLPQRRMFFAEFKRPKDGKTARQQETVHELLRELGFLVYVVDNVTQFENAIKDVNARTRRERREDYEIEVREYVLAGPNPLQPAAPLADSKRHNLRVMLHNALKKASEVTDV